MSLLDKFFIINVGLGLLSFLLNVIYYYRRSKNIKKAEMIDKHIESLDYKEKEDNILILDSNPQDGNYFNDLILYVILSFIPVANIALIYMNLHNIFFLRKDSNEKDN